jgi:hypothetical protein
MMRFLRLSLLAECTLNACFDSESLTKCAKPEYLKYSFTEGGPEYLKYSFTEGGAQAWVLYAVESWNFIVDMQEI